MSDLDEFKEVFRKYFLPIEYREVEQVKYFLNEQFYFCDDKKALLNFIENDLQAELNFTINSYKREHEKTGDNYYHRIYAIDYKNKINVLTDWLENAPDLDLFRDLKKNSGKPREKYSYLWQNNPDKELKELYSFMVNTYHLITPETSYKQFREIFTGQPIKSITPIKWREDNASELLYFINRLEKSHNIRHNVNRADYQKLKACFVKPNGKVFNEAFKSLKTNIEIALSADKRKIIDDLINRF